MANRLAAETSPYLLQHAHNPVDWYPWGPEAFEKARKEDKPIFLSIGYSTCHWCHVMEHESFEDASTAEVLNRHFVNVKVDREERPDVDKIYMTAATGVGWGGGWPLGAVTEVFVEGYGVGELGLLMPALAALTKEDSATPKKWIAWVAPPFVPYAPALQQHGVNVGEQGAPGCGKSSAHYGRDNQKSEYVCQCWRKGACTAVWLTER